MRIVICAIARMENHYIKDWVDYHLTIGFDHIFLYDNAHQGEETIDEVIDVEEEYKGKVTIIPVHDKMHMQTYVYNECYNTQDFDWIAFIDIDEFISFAKDIDTGMPCYTNIKNFLIDRDNAGAVVLNWMTFGDSGMLSDDGRPIYDRLVTPLPYGFSVENVWGKQPFNCHVKTIYKKGLDLLSGISIHTSIGNFNTYDSELERVPQTPIQPKYTFQTCYVRHYITKTLPEYVKGKVARKDNASGDNTTYRMPGFFLFNPPTINRVKLYKSLCKKYRITDTMPLKWWVKQWIKHCLITPFLKRYKSRTFLCLPFCMSAYLVILCL